MQRLRNEFGIYGVDTGRICVAALNSRNIDAVVAGDRQGRLRARHFVTPPPQSALIQGRIRRLPRAPSRHAA